MPCGHRGNPWPRQLARAERQQQLQHNVANGGGVDAGRATGVHQQHDQQWVSTTPRMLDNDALTMAAETWPRAIEVNAMEDCTVDGTRHRNSSPLYRSMLNTEGTNARAASRGPGKSRTWWPAPARAAAIAGRRARPAAATAGCRIEKQQRDGRFGGCGHRLSGGTMAGSRAASATVAARLSRKASIGIFVSQGRRVTVTARAAA